MSAQTSVDAETTGSSPNSLADSAVEVWQHLQDARRELQVIAETKDAAWYRIASTLGGWPPSLIRGDYSVFRKPVVDVVWSFSDSSAPDFKGLHEPSRSELYVHTRVEIPDTEHGKEIMRAVSILAADTSFMRFRPIQPLLGVGATLNKATGRREFPRDYLRDALAAELVTLTERIGMGTSPNTELNDYSASKQSTQLEQTITYLENLLNINGDDGIARFADYYERLISFGYDTVAIAKDISVQYLLPHQMSLEVISQADKWLNGRPWATDPTNKYVSAKWR